MQKTFSYHDAIIIGKWSSITLEIKRHIQNNNVRSGIWRTNNERHGTASTKKQKPPETKNRKLYQIPETPHPTDGKPQ